MSLSPEELREGLAPAFAVGSVGLGAFLLLLLGGAVNAGRVDRKKKGEKTETSSERPPKEL